MSIIHSVQFRDANQGTMDDITGSPYREQDATDVRVWTDQGELIVSVSRTFRKSVDTDELNQEATWVEDFWSISGSDYLHNWQDQAYREFRTWRDAVEFSLISLSIPVSELDQAL